MNTGIHNQQTVEVWVGSREVLGRGLIECETLVNSNEMVS